MIDFHEKSLTINDEILSSALGNHYNYYNTIVSYLKNKFNVIEEWKYYGQKIGWQLKLFHKKRNLFFLTPDNNSFSISFNYGEKAFQYIMQNDYPDFIKDKLSNARKYMEGRGIIVPVNSDLDVQLILKLVGVKINN